MYEFLTPSKLRKSHARSQSSPYLQPTPSAPFTSQEQVLDYNHDSAPSPGIDLPKPSSLVHQSTSTFESSRHVPRLITHDLKNVQPKRPTSTLADWFSGESDPITFAIISSPTKERSDPLEPMDSSSLEQNVTNDKQAAMNRLISKPPIISRFSLFGSKPAVPKAPIAFSDLHDEWHELDVKSALSLPPSADPYSPSALKTLQQKAENLLSRLQAAYKQRSQVLHDVLAEKEAQSEELEGAQMRTRHLKLQLDDMTAKLADQDKAMMDLVDQLAQEKQARREAEHARSAVNTQHPETMKPDEDNHKTDPQYNKRQWKSRTSTASDLSLDSEASCADSLFSRPGATSPAMSMSSVSTVNSPELQHQQQLPLPTNPHQSQQFRQTSTPFSRLSSLTARGKGTSAITAPSNGQCTNCKGHGESEAWNLVGILKLENQGLKSRLGQLESTVDDCLDMVKGLF